MTKRDYEAIAACVREVRDDKKMGPDDLFGVDIAATLAQRLGDDNPRFDGLRFMRACGFSDEVIGNPQRHHAS